LADDKRNPASKMEEDILAPVTTATRKPEVAKTPWQIRFESMCDTLWAFCPGDEDRYWDLAPDVEKMIAEVVNQSDAEILLRAVLSLLELTDARVLFRYCAMALKLLMVETVVAQISLSGIQSAFLNVMKALFKFSKIEGNDVHFVPLLPTLIQLIDYGGTKACDRPLSKETLVFLLGAIKNASLTSEQVQQVITKSGIIKKILSCEDHVQVYIQVTGILRNLTLTIDQAQQFLDAGGFSTLLRISAEYSQHRELLLNISRVLSKLSLQPLVCPYLQEAEETVNVMRQVSRMLSEHGDYSPLCLRLLFFLGNVTARSERVRILFMVESDGTVLIASLLKKYWKLDRQLALACEKCFIA